MFLSQHIALKKIQIIAASISVGCLYLYSSATHAFDLNCTSDTSNFVQRKACSSTFDETRQRLIDKLSTAYLISDAPHRLLSTTQDLWLKRLKQCKTTRCIEQQFEQRTSELTIYITLNQSLTQHYLKTEQGLPTEQTVYLQFHQLNKDRIKIEGIAYRNANNSEQNQKIVFNAYTPTTDKENIQNIENDCQYDVSYRKAYIQLNSKEPKCERFVGLYRLYD